jgi:hypothetical protein
MSQIMEDLQKLNIYIVVTIKPPVLRNPKTNYASLAREDEKMHFFLRTSVSTMELTAVRSLVAGAIVPRRLGGGAAREGAGAAGQGGARGHVPPSRAATRRKSKSTFLSLFVVL